MNSKVLKGTLKEVNSQLQGYFNDSDINVVETNFTEKGGGLYSCHIKYQEKPKKGDSFVTNEEDDKVDGFPPANFKEVVHKLAIHLAETYYGKFVITIEKGAVKRIIKEQSEMVGDEKN